MKEINNKPEIKQSDINPRQSSFNEYSREIAEFKENFRNIAWPNNLNEELLQSFKKDIQSETGWSNKIINHIDTPEQAEIYKNANLHQSKINGRDCLIKNIDKDYVDGKTGLSNRELMAKGRSPIDSASGEKIELHHMGQYYDAPFAELKENSEHGDGNHAVLHPKTEGSWRNDNSLEKEYRKEKINYWKARSNGEDI